MSTAEPLFEFSQFLQYKGGFDFLSPERQQKYDLLLHLLANLGQPLFLSGPDGIGKSTFLQHLHEHPPPGWRICLSQASPELNLEQVQQALARCLGVKDASEKSLPSQLETLWRHDETVVLALDEVGSMIPGMLDTVCRFAAQCPALRLVAAVRPDDLHIKAVTDPWAVGEAHVIELPPLTESQCTDYLNRLWTRLGRSGEPDQAAALEIYRRSHGIPARIRQEVMDLVGRPPMRWHLALAKPVYLALGIVGVAVVAVTYWQAPLLRQLPAADKAEPVLPPKPQEKPTVLATEASPAAQPSSFLPQENPKDLVRSAGDRVTGGPQSAVPTPPPIAEPLPSVSDRAVQPAAVSEPKALPGESQVLKTSAQAEENSNTQAADVPAEAPKPPTEALGLDLEPKLKALGVNSQQWLARQKPTHFSLQLAVSDRPENLLALAKRYPKLRPLTIAVKTEQGRSRYVLLYGAFADIGAVERAVRKLPADIGSASVRRFSSVQMEFSP